MFTAFRMQNFAEYAKSIQYFSELVNHLWKIWKFLHNETIPILIQTEKTSYWYIFEAPGLRFLSFFQTTLSNCRYDIENIGVKKVEWFVSPKSVARTTINGFGLSLDPIINLILDWICSAALALIHWPQSIGQRLSPFHRNRLENFNVDNNTKIALFEAGMKIIAGFCFKKRNESWILLQSNQVLTTVLKRNESMVEIVRNHEESKMNHRKSKLFPVNQVRTNFTTINES